MEEWTVALDDNKQVDTVYFDFRKTFESVPHNRLLKKLEGYGIKGTLLQGFKKFLKVGLHSSRKNRVQCHVTNINHRPV